MTARVADWYHGVENSEVQLLAGEEGLSRHFLRAYIVERPEFSPFLEGQEIVFILGVALHSGEELTETVVNCCRAGVSAIVVNTGTYIKEVPAEALQFCQEHGLPLFAVPWHVHVESLMQKAFQLTVNAQSKDSTLEQLVRSAILEPARQDLYIPGLTRCGFLPEWKYCVALARPAPESAAGCPEDWLSRAVPLVWEQLDRQDHGVVLTLNQTLVVLFVNYSPEMAEGRMEQLCQQLNEGLGLPDPLCFSIGRCTKSVRCISKSYALAEKILNYQMTHSLPAELHAYNRLGIYKMIIGLENQDILTELREEYLEPLRAYDKTCGTDYLDFIRTYLYCDGSVQEVSRRMFIHRNTVHYKIHKVEEILDCDMQRIDTKMYLLIAIISDQLDEEKSM